MHRANQLSHSQLQRAARLAVSWPGPVLGRVGRGRVARGCVFQARLATRPGRCTRAKPVVATRTSAHWDCGAYARRAVWPTAGAGCCVGPPRAGRARARPRGDRPIRDRGGHVYQNEFGIADMNHCDGTMHQCSVDNGSLMYRRGSDPRLIGVSTLRLHAMPTARRNGARRCNESDRGRGPAAGRRDHPLPAATDWRCHARPRRHGGRAR